MSLIASIEYERIKRRVWTLDESEIKAALRRHVKASPLCPAAINEWDLRVEIGEYGDGAYTEAKVTWENVQPDTAPPQDEPTP